MHVVSNVEEFNLLEIIESAEKSALGEGVEIVSENPTLLWKKFKKHFEFIEAAGGVVFNENKELLAIFRLGKWDLPKGKMEKGESREESAVREVEEECGISGLKIVRELTPIYHVYNMKGKRCLKVTYWYEMITNFKGVLKPQLEEDITEVKWISDKNEILKNTYASIAELITSV